MNASTLLVNLIKEMPKTKARYTYATEKNINPGYCDIEHSPPLCVEDTRIWVLRSDLILALGIKDISEDNVNIINKVDSCVQHYIDPEDRYGHPSLTIAEYGYDGSAYYAGWLRQQLNKIEVFLYSGRYRNKLLNTLQRQYIERYITIQLIKRYGEQDIIFFDWNGHSGELHAFIQGQFFFSKQSRRSYSLTTIKSKNLLDLAIEHKDDLIAINLFVNGAKISAPASNKTHIFHVLARNGLVNPVRHLLAKNRQLINLLDVQKQTPLIAAAAKGQHRVVALLLAQGADTSIMAYRTPDQEHPYSALDWAFESNNKQTIQVLLNKGARANYIHHRINGQSLKKSIKYNDFNALLLFVQSNVNYVNYIDKKGYSPLHYAAHYGALKIVLYLIKAGANVNITSRDSPYSLYPNMTAINIAMIKEHDHIVRALLKYPVQIPQGIDGTDHLIHMAAKNGWIKCIQKLITSHPELIHLRDSLKKTPILWAASRGHHQIVALFIAMGADVNNMTQCHELTENAFHHYSALDWAIAGNHTKTIKILSDAGAIAHRRTVDCSLAKNETTPVTKHSFNGTLFNARSNQQQKQEPNTEYFKKTQCIF